MSKIDIYLTIDDVIELTGYSKQTLANWRSKKEMFPFYKLGRRIVYKRSELISIIENGKVEVNQKEINNGFL